MELALYHPEIPQNTGTLLRLGACLGVKVHIIEPCGFVWNDRKLLRAGMDYLDLSQVKKHDSWSHFLDSQRHDQQRLVLVDVKGTDSFHHFAFQPDDVLIMGRESDGVPESVFDEVDQIITIPMTTGARSINMALSATIVLSEGLRQIGTYDTLGPKNRAL